MTALNRRRALSGTAAIAVGVPVLAACGGSDTTATDTSTAPTDTADPDTETSSPSEGGGSGGGEALASVSDIPVGGGAIFADDKVVVTQPTEGTFLAFSVTCTHQGCPVTSVDATINCSCHGSQFSLEDGSPTSGPATSPLAAVDIVVDGNSITLA